MFQFWYLLCVVLQKSIFELSHPAELDFWNLKGIDFSLRRGYRHRNKPFSACLSYRLLKTGSYHPKVEDRLKPFNESRNQFADDFEGSSKSKF